MFTNRIYFCFHFQLNFLAHFKICFSNGFGSRAIFMRNRAENIEKTKNINEMDRPLEIYCSFLSLFSFFFFSQTLFSLFFTFSCLNWCFRHLFRKIREIRQIDKYEKRKVPITHFYSNFFLSQLTLKYIVNDPTHYCLFEPDRDHVVCISRIEFETEYKPAVERGTQYTLLAHK